MDLLVEERLIVEVKAVSSLTAIHTAQLISYLKAANLTLGLLLNFGARRLCEGLRRIVRSP